MSAARTRSTRELAPKLSWAIAALSCGFCSAIVRADPALAVRDTQASDTTPAQTTVAPARTKPVSEEARACFQAAQTAYVAGDLATALEGFKCAYAAAPSAELDYNLARVYERMGDAEESTRHYRAYLAQAEVTPKELKRIQARLQSLQELRERQRPPLPATKPSAEALSAEARVFYDRGVKLYRAKQYESAMAAFSAALQMSSAPELHFNLAVVSERLDHPQEAVDHYRAYLAARGDARDRDQIESRIHELQAER